MTPRPGQRRQLCIRSAGTPGTWILISTRPVFASSETTVFSSRAFLFDGSTTGRDDLSASIFGSCTFTVTAPLRVQPNGLKTTIGTPASAGSKLVSTRSATVASDLVLISFVDQRTAS